MKGYFKRSRQNMAELASSSDLPENALQWAAVLKADKPEFSYKFVNTYDFFYLQKVMEIRYFL